MDMTETDHLNGSRNMEERASSPSHSPGRPMRQLEFNQAMSDFRHMFPDTDEEVIEAVLRANSGMVDATIDQLLTMNIDSASFKDDEDDDDLPDHVLVSMEREVLAQQQMQHHQGSRRNRESRSAKKQSHGDSFEKSKEPEDCPPSYTEAVQSHLSHHHRPSTRRHHSSPTWTKSGSGHHRHGAQSLGDTGQDSPPPPEVSSSTANGNKMNTQRSHHTRHHHHQHSRSSNHHRRRADNPDSSPHKSRPGRNLLASSLPHETPSDEFGFRRQRVGSLDSNDFLLEPETEKSPQRWRPSHRESSSTKRPAFRNWNPPMLGTLPDDFLRVTPATSSASTKHAPHLHRAMSAVGPERPKFSTAPSRGESGQSWMGGHGQQHAKPGHKPHRSLSFAGHGSGTSGQQQHVKQKSPHPSGLAQHEFTSDILQERMKENERKWRHIGSAGLDSETTQYLEDERLAIMLQNSEFLQELRGDTTFMMTLERDHKSVEGDSTGTKDTMPEPVNHSGLNSDEEEGYGDDKRDTLEAFPFSQQLPSAGNEDVELRKKLRNMGKASKKQFAALAKKFFTKRKKKSAQQILKESQAPSMMNLLGEEDDDDDLDNRDNGEHNSATDSYGNRLMPSSGLSSWNSSHTDKV